MLINQTRLKEMGSSKSEQRIVTLKMVFGISHDRLFFSTTDKRLRAVVHSIDSNVSVTLYNSSSLCLSKSTSKCSLS